MSSFCFPVDGSSKFYIPNNCSFHPSRKKCVVKSQFLMFMNEKSLCNSCIYMEIMLYWNHFKYWKEQNWKKKFFILSCLGSMNLIQYGFNEMIFSNPIFKNHDSVLWRLCEMENMNSIAVWIFMLLTSLVAFSLSFTSFSKLCTEDIENQRTMEIIKKRVDEVCTIYGRNMKAMNALQLEVTPSWGRKAWILSRWYNVITAGQYCKASLSVFTLRNPSPVGPTDTNYTQLESPAPCPLPSSDWYQWAQDWSTLAIIAEYLWLIWWVFIWVK